MKKITMLLLYLLLVIPAAYCLEKNSAVVDTMIQSRQFLQKENKAVFYDECKDLGLETKLRIYDKYQMNPLFGAGLNFLVPSLGSWLQGDYAGAIFTDVGVYGFGIVGIISVINLSQCESSANSKFDEVNRLYDAGGHSGNTDYSRIDQLQREEAQLWDQITFYRYLSVTALVIIGVCEVANLIFPVVYANDYNKQLANAINGFVEYEIPTGKYLVMHQAKTEQLFHLNLVRIQF